MKTNAMLMKMTQAAIYEPLHRIAGDWVNPMFIAEEHYEKPELFPWNVHPLAFLEYDENRILARNRELGWEKPDDTDSNSTNCLLNAFANHVHKEKYGFNPYVWEIANMVRNGCMTREDGLEKIETKEAIEELEKLRFAWRGDDFEFNLLRKLGTLYFTEKDFRNALLSLKQAATHFRRHPRTPEVTQEMSLAFTRLYLDGDADDMPPVRAIALYEEFKELTPAGEKGDLMIRRLADRLVAVDLLDRAAKLLENQVNFRLKGVEKAKVGAKLALIHMMNRKLEQAIKVLADTDGPGLPAELAETRRHLQARTLMELKRNDQALVVLTDDESRAADVIRAEMFWRSQNWPDAAQSLRRVVKAMEIPRNAKLDNKQGKYILNLGVSLVLGGNERGLARVREKYEAQMNESAYADAFQLITSASSRGLIDFRTVSRRVKEVESFQAFMAAYQERLNETEEKQDAEEGEGPKDKKTAAK